MIYTAKLTGADIVDILAQHFKVERKAVKLTAHRGYEGHALDNQPPYVDAEISVDGGLGSTAEKPKGV